MAARILLTAFDPFAGRASNASDRALARLLAHPERLPGLTLIGRRLPVEAGRAVWRQRLPRCAMLSDWMA